MIESESPEKVDQLSFDLPIMKEIGNQVKIEVTPIIPYYSFANFLFENFGEEKSARASDTGVDVAKEGIFYWLVFNIEYAGVLVLYYEKLTTKTFLIFSTATAPV